MVASPLSELDMRWPESGVQGSPRIEEVCLASEADDEDLGKGTKCMEMS